MRTCSSCRSLYLASALLLLAACSGSDDSVSLDTTSAATSPATSLSGPPSDVTSETTGAQSLPPLPPPAPEEVVASDDDAEAVQLSWSPVAAAERYVVERDGVPIAEIEQNSYSDAGAGGPSLPVPRIVAALSSEEEITLEWEMEESRPGRTHNYRVRAEANGQQSDASEVAVGQRRALVDSGFQILRDGTEEHTTEERTWIRTIAPEEAGLAPAFAAAIVLRAAEGESHLVLDLEADLPAVELPAPALWSVRATWEQGAVQGEASPEVAAGATLDELVLSLRRDGAENPVATRVLTGSFSEGRRVTFVDEGANPDGSSEVYTLRAEGALFGGEATATGSLRAALAPGEPCAKDAACESAFCDPDSASCRQPLGGTCAAQEECAAALACDAGTCEEPLWSSVATSRRATCGTRTDDTLWCWGLHEAAELGTGIGEGVVQPRRVALAAARLVPAAPEAFCAIDPDDALWCWGRNDAGAMGLGDVLETAEPLPVGEAGARWQTAALSPTHGCGIRDDDTLWCWGSGVAESVGATPDSRVEEPQEVLTEEGFSWRDVTVAEDHTCALRSDGTLWCWGLGQLGQLGLGQEIGAGAERVPLPSQVGEDDDWSAVRAAGTYTCAVRSGSTLWCWGAGLDDYGIEHGEADLSRPVPFPWGEAIVDVRTLSGAICGLTAEGSLICMGYFPPDEPDGLIRLEPELVPVSSRSWIDVVGGQGQAEPPSPLEVHFCGLTRQGSLLCRGFNDSGQVAISTVDDTRPRRIDGSRRWVRLAQSNAFACGVCEEGMLWCWGSRADFRTAQEMSQGWDNTPRRVGDASDWFDVALGNDFGCGLRAEGELWCWGRVTYRTGDQSSPPIQTPERLGEASDWRALDMSSSNGCALNAASELWCWGANGASQIQAGLASRVAEPVRVGDRTWRSVSTGALFTCAIALDDSLWCWGSNGTGQVGSEDTFGGTVSSPQEIPLGGQGALEVSAGINHTCAIAQNGSLWCWGASADGRTGLGEGEPIVTRPQQVGATRLWSAISSGTAHSCGLEDDGVLWCWGANDFNELGLGEDVGPTNVPRRVRGPQVWQGITAGNGATYAIEDDGLGWSWGREISGQLGDGAYFDTRWWPVDLLASEP